MTKLFFTFLGSDEEVQFPDIGTAKKLLNQDLPHEASGAGDEDGPVDVNNNDKKWTCHWMAAMIRAKTERSDALTSRKLRCRTLRPFRN